MIRIAVDGMGGDYAPAVVVDGAVQAANDFFDIAFVRIPIYMIFRIVQSIKVKFA